MPWRNLYRLEQCLNMFRQYLDNFWQVHVSRQYLDQFEHHPHNIWTSLDRSEKRLNTPRRCMNSAEPCLGMSYHLGSSFLGLDSCWILSRQVLTICSQVGYSGFQKNNSNVSYSRIGFFESFVGSSENFSKNLTPQILLPNYLPK